MCDIHVGVLLAFIECLNVNKVSVSMICNYLAAIRDKFIMYGLSTVSLDDRKLHYFVKSLKINRPLSITKCNIISIEDLYAMVTCCDSLYMGQVYKTVFLVAFFGFFRLSNLCPHSLNTYDFTRHLAGGDVFWDENSLKILIKWSKTLQSRDKVKIITLPSLGRAAICPLRAVKKLFKLYNRSNNDPLFQFKYPSGWQVLIDSKVKKTLSFINSHIGYIPHYFTFHSFRRSGASLAFASFCIYNESKCKAHGRPTVYGIIYTLVQIIPIKLHLHLLGYIAYKCCRLGLRVLFS